MSNEQRMEPSLKTAASEKTFRTHRPVVRIKPLTYCALDRLPTALMPLTKRRRWVVWRWERKQKKDGSIGWTKVPYQCAHPDQKAENDNSRTWGDYATALALYRENKVDGIGYMLLKGEVAALDIDKCRDPESGLLTAQAQDFVTKATALGAYVEVTVSGTGLRIIGTGKKDKVQRVLTNIKVEVYRKCERYITISGLQQGECTELPNIDALIDETIKDYDRKKRENATASNNNERETLSDDEYQELLEHGTIRGIAPEHRGPEFHALVWHLAHGDKSLDDIIALLRAHPNGIAAKYLQPTDRLAEEAKRSFDKFQHAVPDFIARWNERHAHVLAGSKISVLHEYRTPEGYLDFKLLSSASFHEWNAEHKIVVGEKDGEDIVVPATKLWIKHPKRRKYQDIGFFPEQGGSGFLQSVARVCGRTAPGRLLEVQGTSAR